VRYQDIIRLVLAVMFFLGAAANAVMLVTTPDVYEGFADLSFLRFYRTLWRGVVLPRLGLFLALVIIFEIMVGVLLLSRGPYAQLGLILAAGYAAFLVPFWWGGGGLINILLFLIILWLLRFGYSESIPSLVFG
jgi:hypothetical protein